MVCVQNPGAGQGFNGCSVVHTHMTNSRITDPEVLEWRFPVLLSEFLIRAQSGGQGRWHGGDGVVRRIRFLEPMKAGILFGCRVIPPFGLNGGIAGKPGVNRVIHGDGQVEVIPGCAEIEMKAGDQFQIETPGEGDSARSGGAALFTGEQWSLRYQKSQLQRYYNSVERRCMPPRKAD
ncbi:MAG: hydantoinase B/oxoprolinase family protein [Methylomicrobium sp.]